ncbi:MAG: hypothetical protein FJ387_01360 [Verrucomicrobia bacterium]|nr:hypothetical protein [Verrucomicrobiota bacterium]
MKSLTPQPVRIPPGALTLGIGVPRTVPRRTSPRAPSSARISLGLLAVGLAVAGRAATFNADFNTGIPIGVNLFGTALNYDHSTGGVNNTGVLKLTDTTGSQQGGAIIDDFDFGATIGGFEVTFDLYIGSGSAADGMSFFFGDFADGAYSEEGPGSIGGLTVNFDVYNNGGTPAEAPAIDLKWNNAIQIHRLVGAASTTTGAQPIGSANTIRTQTAAGGAPVYWPVKIRVDTDGTLDLVYNSVVVYTNVPIFRAITEFTRSPSGSARFGFGARTGGSTDNHWVDNLKITTFPLDTRSGQPHMVACLPLAMLNQTTGGPGSAVGGVSIDLQDWDYSVQPGSVTLTVNGATVTPSLVKAGNISRITYRGPTGFLSAGVNTIVVGYSTTSSPAFANTFTYTALVGTASAIDPIYRLASADTTKPGFKAKVYQIDVNRNPATGQFLNAERQIAGGYIDPLIGQPYPNTAMTDWMDSLGTIIGTADAQGYFTVPGVVNWNQDAPTAIGNFSVNSTPPFEDQPVPGITGNFSQNTTDRYVFSIETILELKAGGYRFGVNSDDGFRLSIGRGPGDVVGAQLGTAGDRASADTIMDVVIPADGFYPFRLMWFETGGGSNCEFFFLDETGVRRLINDATAPTPIMAYRESVNTPPYISRALPAVAYNWTYADQDLVLDVTDGGSPLNAGSAVLTLNGVTQTIAATKTGRVTTLRRASSVANLLPSGTVSAVLTYTYNDLSDGGTVKTVSNSWAFNVPPYTRPIPLANRVQAGQVTGAGFKVRTHQLDRSGDANQGNGGRYTGQNGGGNNMPRAEIQLTDGYISRATGLPYPNRAAAGPNPDGTYDIFEVLNFNHSTTAGAGGVAANAGIFNLDTQIPGVPGTGTSNSGLDNVACEFTTYLDLKAGAHILAVNVDDGWTCISAPNVKDTLGTLLGWRNAPGGQNGNPAHYPNAVFNIIVLEDGIYPIRILFWQGGGGINLEFFSLDRQTGTQILVNDPFGAYPSVVGNSGQLNSPITAYSAYSGSTRPWVKFSVYPMPTHATLWQNTIQQTGPGPIRITVPGGNPADLANDEPRFDQALVNLPFGEAVGAIVADLGSGSVGMVLNGESVTPTVTTVLNSTDKLVVYTPNPPLPSGSTNTAGLVYAGTTNYWTFRVSTYVDVPAGVALPSTEADLAAVGFRAKVVQSTAARPGGNTVAAAEAQLTGTPANVVADGPGPDGSYLVPGIINWSHRRVPGQSGAEIGNFIDLAGMAGAPGFPDQPIPGLPGTGATKDNATAEIFAYLDLPAGYQKFGINGDDGWKVQIGLPGETTGTVLFSRDRGAGARDIPFAFITPEAGLYPIRLLWYQGGGDANLEFFTYGANNTKIPVNDRNNPNAVKAYYAVKTVAPPTIAIAQQPDGKVHVTFTGKLQSSSSLSPASWQDVAGATSPLDVTANDPERYYRTVNP